MNITFSNTYKSSIPENYGQVDEFLSRSAQPKKENFIWLKEQGVTDVFNFRLANEKDVIIDEKELVESLGMKYHKLASITQKPNENNIKIFLTNMADIIKNGGKAHVHCKAGADRTGMYVFLYKMLNNLGKQDENLNEWMKFGHHKNIFPNLMDWTVNFIRKLK